MGTSTRSHQWKHAHDALGVEFDPGFVFTNRDPSWSYPSVHEFLLVVPSTLRGNITRRFRAAPDSCKPNILVVSWGWRAIIYPQRNPLIVIVSMGAPMPPSSRIAVTFTLRNPCAYGSSPTEFALTRRPSLRHRMSVLVRGLQMSFLGTIKTDLSSNNITTREDATVISECPRIGTG
jgi:hypothetical protein